MNHAKDFNKKTVSGLAKLNISIIGTQAIPAFEGDKYFTGIGYNLEWNGCGYIRTHSEVIAISLSSLNPFELLEDAAEKNFFMVHPELNP